MGRLHTLRGGFEQAGVGAMLEHSEENLQQRLKCLGLHLRPLHSTCSCISLQYSNSQYTATCILQLIAASCSGPQMAS